VAEDEHRSMPCLLMTSNRVQVCPADVASQYSGHTS
jgi:hypothetical protein